MSFIFCVSDTLTSGALPAWRDGPSLDVPIPSDNKDLATSMLLKYKATMQSLSSNHLPHHTLKTLSPGLITHGGHRPLATASVPQSH